MDGNTESSPPANTSPHRRVLQHILPARNESEQHTRLTPAQLHQLASILRAGGAAMPDSVASTFVPFGMRARVAKRKRFACDACDKSFGKMCDLKAHKRKHTGEKPYVCPREDCQRRFAWRSSLKSHMDTHEDQGTAVTEVGPQAVPDKKTEGANVIDLVNIRPSENCEKAVPVENPGPVNELHKQTSDLDSICIDLDLGLDQEEQPPPAPKAPLPPRPPTPGSALLPNLSPGFRQPRRPQSPAVPGLESLFRAQAPLTPVVKGSEQTARPRDQGGFWLPRPQPNGNMGGSTPSALWSTSSATTGEHGGRGKDAMQWIPRPFSPACGAVSTPTSASALWSTGVAPGHNWPVSPLPLTPTAVGGVGPW
eukprot:CAMPEP_0198329994 /NCGR_PEP_ID=MMETSP1450-20131203/16597_1 /TAXON_ID=753684 ORGANISM="Madagascaria erythrocladiodes, Strain CCMP3234" /NCGR_SAMPLE_ID=MMETSP1450 /ASSEMBLY_ACC=CAM_ASM_001115 /LENGTH=366 /DNA_ID=CAMNT_0044034255 /DNA_START=1232 /DNA_END=2332 /DNA_ORIENTATION=+